MQIFKKEKKVVELVLDHVDKTGEGLRLLVATLRAYSKGDQAGLEEAATIVERLETEADTVLRQIRELLYSGAFLPTIRGDLYRLLSAIDKIANRVESCLDFTNQQRPGNIRAYRAEFNDILDHTAQCFSALRLALEAYFDPRGEIDDLRLHAAEVSRIESAIDSIQRSLTSTIFQSDLTLSEKMHLAQLLLHVVRISDQAENAVDELELLSLKSII